MREGERRRDRERERESLRNSHTHARTHAHAHTHTRRKRDRGSEGQVTSTFLVVNPLTPHICSDPLGDDVREDRLHPRAVSSGDARAVGTGPGFMPDSFPALFVCWSSRNASDS